ncbi:MAG: hypothetical protein H6739_09800 [Alphaproteobacteria bacterium]|nr:hypothetical protein [Alphaproteobacteria bacterium]
MRRVVWLVALAVAGCKDDTDVAETGVGDDTGVLVDEDGDGVGAAEDCDDGDASVHPGAEEVCDGVDNNCDDVVDEGVTTTWYGDGDADGYGADDQTLEACAQPEGYAAAGGDCDDSDPAWHPGAVEDDCTDPNDYNCDGSVGYADADGDGFAACAECDDADAAIHPGATEVCDEVDNNCDGSIDEGVTGTYYQDSDGDGHGDPAFSTEACAQPTGYVATATDCDDGDGAVNPDAVEVCNGIDDDCDTLVDDEDSSVDTSTGAAWYADSDADGYGDSDSVTWSCTQPSGAVSDATDCDDGDAAVNPAATEVCNGIDDDCDGATDDADSDLDTSTGSAWYADSDADTYGDASSVTWACTQPSGTVSDATDCDDGDATVNPAGSESCDGVDNDCDGTVDNDSAVLGDAATCAGLDCDDVLTARGSLSDGVYWISPDGTPFEAYCDMTTDGGGWTLLLTADGSSSYWGNNSANWSSTSYDTTVPDPLDSDDFHSRAYSELDTDEIRICYTDTSACYTFTHNYAMSLYDFFATGTTYTLYSSGSTNLSDAGSASDMTDYISDLGFTVHSTTCQWLGINNTVALSAIGLMGDWNCGCQAYFNANPSCATSGYPYHDDLALGVGLQSCYDSNGCSYGGSGNLAGQSRGLNGSDNSGVFGPWHVFGR